MTTIEFKPSRDLVMQIVAAVHLYSLYDRETALKREYNAYRHTRDLLNARVLIYKSINHIVVPRLRVNGGRRTDALFERVYLVGWAEASRSDELVRLASRDCQMLLRPRFRSSTKRPRN